MIRKQTTFGKLRTIRSLSGKSLRIDIENGSYVVIKKIDNKWKVLFEKEVTTFEGSFNEAVKYAWEVVEWVDSDCHI